MVVMIWIHKDDIPIIFIIIILLVLASIIGKCTRTSPTVHYTYEKYNGSVFYWYDEKNDILYDIYGYGIYYEYRWDSDSSYFYSHLPFWRDSTIRDWQWRLLLERENKIIDSLDELEID
jgi:hypothetical protein